MFNSACLAKNVLANAGRSWIGRLAASAHHDVNSKECDVLLARFVPEAYHEELHVLEEAGAGPEAVPLVAVDLIERLTDVHTAPLELDVHHRQAVHQHRHVVAVGAGRAAFALGDLVLVDYLEPVVVDVALVDEHDVLGGPVVALQDLDMVLLDAPGLLCRSFIRARDLLREEPLPLGVAERDPIESLKLRAEVRDERGLARERQVFVGLGLQELDECLLQGGLGLIRRLLGGFRKVLGNDRALRAHGDRVVAHAST